MDTTIHTALASDRNYLSFAAMTAAGIAEYTTRPVVIHFLYENLDEKDFALFDFLDKYPHVSFLKHQISDAFFKDWPGMRWSRAVYYRLILPDLLPDVEKIIYLDCDLAVLDDLGKLYDEPFNGSSCMAVVTKISMAHIEKLGIPAEEYFNSGVLVFSPAEWKRRNMIERFKKCFEEYSSLLRYPDQDILNFAFRNEVRILHPRWNLITSTYRNAPVSCYTLEEVKEALRAPGIAHYTGDHKPWMPTKTFHHPYSLALTHLAEISGQKKIAWILKLKSIFLPHIARTKHQLPWDKNIIDTALFEPKGK